MENGELVLTRSKFMMNKEEQKCSQDVIGQTDTSALKRDVWNANRKPFLFKETAELCGVQSLTQLVLCYIEQFTFAKARNFPSDHQKSTPPFS